MPPSGLALLCLFLLLIFSCCAYSWPEEKPSAYEALKQYDLPAGLLPEGVTWYDLNPSTGEFSAYLNGNCKFSLTNLYQLGYKPTISGFIYKDQLTKLRGVSVKVLKPWLRVKEVRRDGESLVFSVSFSSAKFPVKDFNESPRCGCGFSCNATVGEDHGINQNSHNIHLSSS